VGKQNAFSRVSVRLRGLLGFEQTIRLPPARRAINMKDWLLTGRVRVTLLPRLERQGKQNVSDLAAREHAHYRKGL